MKIFLRPLYSQLNQGIGRCPLSCEQTCRVHQAAPQLEPPEGASCPLSSHQAQTYAQVISGDADLIFNEAATGDGKSLGASLPGLLDINFRLMGLYPTIELVEDQTEQQKKYHHLFSLNAEERIDRLFGTELASRVKEANSNRFQELLLAIQTKPIILTNPDIFHLITHYQYRDPAVAQELLPMILAGWPDLWVFDEFHIFGAHQEAAVLNSITLIRQTQQQKKRFLFTSATPKTDFIEQFQQAGFKVKSIKGIYTNEATVGYRQILQPVELELVELKGTNTLTWVKDRASEIEVILKAESQGRGLIILNSVALAGRVATELQKLLPEVEIREISGRIDRQERSQTQIMLQNIDKPVLVVATSAVDVGVDFKIHLLIFESSDSATVIQRLGRLGRHSGFSTYKAFLLISEHTPWVMARLQDKLGTEATVTREILKDAIVDAFDAPKEFVEYRNRWGALQAQGMFARITAENAKVSQKVCDRMKEDLQQVYGQKIESARREWYKLSNKDNPVGKATQTELLRFRGGSTLQAAVRDGKRFYTYDLLRLLPYVTVEIIERETFVKAASQVGYTAEVFPQEYLKVYLEVKQWVDERFNLTLHCNRDSDELTVGKLSLLSRLNLDGHPQSEVIKCLSQQKLLAFLVPVNRRQPNSHWDVSRHLHLSPLFGLYRLTDGGGQAYACAFNQDALLLESLNWRLQKFYRNQPQSLIF